MALEQRAESAAASGNGRVSPLQTLHEPYAARGVLTAALAPANAAAEASKPRRVPTSKPLVDARVDVAAAAAAAAPAVAAIAVLCDRRVGLVRRPVHVRGSRCTRDLMRSSCYRVSGMYLVSGSYLVGVCGSLGTPVIECIPLHWPLSRGPLRAPKGPQEGALSFPTSHHAGNSPEYPLWRGTSLRPCGRSLDQQRRSRNSTTAAAADGGSHFTSRRHLLR